MIIGITGSLGTGKSTVCKYLADHLRAHLIDADRIAHRALTRGYPAYRTIVSVFGRGILDKNGSVDRQALAEKVFSSRKNLDILCRVVHPVVSLSIRRKIAAIYRKDNKAFIIIDAPLLIEAGLHKECDWLVVVSCSLSTQLERAQHYRSMRAADTIKRITFQMPLSRKVTFADRIIDNNGGLYELKKKTRGLAMELKTKTGGKRW
ncbi:MAG: dephospho-CoA kinase [Candidatus Omnitrophica bacterium]|nr:dephospho-CoA kinase [Candidatus Omnitrophota bacterium]